MITVSSTQNKSYLSMRCHQKFSLKVLRRYQNEIINHLFMRVKELKETVSKENNII